MNEDRKARWLAMWLPLTMSGPRQPWRFPYVGAVQDGDFYHWGGSTRMPFDDLEEREVLKDYGEMTSEEWDDAGGDAQWHRDFPPIQGGHAEFVGTSLEAWIGPGGELYLCEHQGHEFLAERLVRSYGIVEPDESLSRSGDLLQERGWARVYFDWVSVRGNEPTQPQLDTLWDILDLIKDDDHRVKLANSIRGIFELPEAPLPKTSARVAREMYAGEITDDELDEEGVLSFCRLCHESFTSYPSEWEEGWARCPKCDELCDEVPPDDDAAKSELLGVVCDAVEARTPESEPYREPETRKLDLKSQPYVDVTVRFYRSHMEGGAVMSFTDAMCVTTAHADDGSKMGTIEGRMGAFELCDRRRPYSDHYRAPHDEVWHAFQKALDELDDQQLPEDAPT